MKVLVVGTTGVLGRQVVPRLLERGHAVRALVRAPQQAARMQRVGVEPVVGDILDAASLGPAAAGCEAALHLATAIPRPGDPSDWTLNDRIRREGTRNLLAAARAADVRRYVQQSITFLYGDQGTRIADEDAPLQPSPTIQSAADMEQIVRESALDWCILRGGAFYGPGTGSEDRWRQAALSGQLVTPGDGSALISLVHVVDMARAVVCALEQAPAASTYNVVDDQPVTYRELYSYIAPQVDAPAPGSDGPAVRSLACTNAKLKRELGWAPAFPTYRSGLA